MIEFIESAPQVNVHPAEYRRLLGYPRDHEIGERAQELADGAREWYRQHGRPWFYARQIERVDVQDGRICLDGAAFTSQRLASILRKAEAHSAFVAAVSAGPEAEEEAHRLWLAEKPDEYFFLETFASAVVEQLIVMAGGQLCAWAEGDAMAVLPHYSPGYSQWDVAEQCNLLGIVSRAELPGPLETLSSGALRPKKSQLAVFGLTRQVDRVRSLSDLVPCQNCSLANCQYRRSAPASYSVNTRALARWSAERLSIHTRADGTTEARFRFDGTTCNNMGRPLAFQYDVLLGPPQDGYPIREQHCAPVPGDTGHMAMCQYQVNAGPLMAAIDRERPLFGQPLANVFAWRRDFSPSGCYCDSGSREHKWGLVLETIHYALDQQKLK